MAIESKVSVALITTVSDIYVRGPRKLAGFLRKHGVEVTEVFMPMEPRYTGLGPHCVSEIPQKIVDQLFELTQHCTIIGFSAMTDYMPMVRQLGTAYRKKFPKKMILLGGVHAIQAPEYAIQESYLDGVCTGEGELPLLNLVINVREQRDYTQTRGFFFKSNGNIIRNSAGDYVDLDALPFVDYVGGWIALNDGIEAVTDKHIKMFFGSTYWTDRSRGCPFKCSFCIHSKLVEDKNNPLRWNSMEYFVEETRRALELYPFFDSIYFNDETFTVQKLPDLKEFSVVYKSTIGLPFSTYVDPFSATTEKLDYLFEAGLTKLKMGVQSGSRRLMSEVFDRSPNFEHIEKLTKHIATKWRGKIPLPVYDLITNVPWATREDIEENFKTIARFAPPFHCQVFTLAHYPGSTLFRRAIADKIVDPDNLPQQNHLATRPSLSNSLLQLLGIARLPNWFITFLTKIGLAASERKSRFLFKFTNTLGWARRAVWQVWYRDSTLMPFRVSNFFQKLGWFNARKAYEAAKPARDRFLEGYQPPHVSLDDSVLISMPGRERTVGSFNTKLRKSDKAAA